MQTQRPATHADVTMYNVPNDDVLDSGEMQA